MRASKLQSKAEKYEMTEKKNTGDYTKKISECLELLNSGNADKSTVSELLFASAGVSRTIGFEPEELLYEHNEAFLKIFEE